jgi:hypothetical protein
MRLVPDYIINPRGASRAESTLKGYVKNQRNLGHIFWPSCSVWNKFSPVDRPCRVKLAFSARVLGRLLISIFILRASLPLALGLSGCILRGATVSEWGVVNTPMTWFRPMLSPTCDGDVTVA